MKSTFQRLNRRRFIRVSAALGVLTGVQHIMPAYAFENTGLQNQQPLRGPRSRIAARLRKQHCRWRRSEKIGPNLSMIAIGMARCSSNSSNTGRRRAPTQCAGTPWVGMVAITTAGEGGGGAEVQALYGRLIAPFWDLQAGLRYGQFSGAGFDRSRGFAVIGLQGLARHRFDLEPALFISQDGDVSARLTAAYDMLLTQRLVLQPRLDFDAAVQSAETFGVGKSANSIGLGLRLRYEITREFAPYIGIDWLRRFGETADFSRRNGARAESIGVVLGVRLWF
jgi:uncharacterized protein involved in copper resistance